MFCPSRLSCPLAYHDSSGTVCDANAALSNNSRNTDKKHRKGYTWTQSGGPVGAIWIRRKTQFQMTSTQGTQTWQGSV